MLMRHGSTLISPYDKYFARCTIMLVNKCSHGASIEIRTRKDVSIRS